MIAPLLHAAHDPERWNRNHALRDMVDALFYPTFAWLGRWRLLAREYSYRPETTAADILWAMTHLMLRRLA